MSTFKNFPELKVSSIDPDTGEVFVQSASGQPVISVTNYRSEDEIRRMVECWNACRKLFSPAAHIESLEDRIERVERLRKEAWSRAQVRIAAEEVAAAAYVAPSSVEECLR